MEKEEMEEIFEEDIGNESDGNLKEQTEEYMGRWKRLFIPPKNPWSYGKSEKEKDEGNNECKHLQGEDKFYLMYSDPTNARLIDKPVRVFQKYIRIYLSKKELEKLRKRRLKRIAFLLELVTTEISYLNGLEILVEVYLEPLRKLSQVRKNPVITKSEFKVMFGKLPIRSLLYFHRVLSETMRKSIFRVGKSQRKILIDENVRRTLEYYSNSTIEELEKVNYRVNIANAFTSIIVPLCLKYEKYYENWTRSRNYWINLLKNFSKRKLRVVTDKMNRDDRTNKLGIHCYMQFPVSRFPGRYRMLLRDIRRNTEMEHPDHKKLGEILDTLSEYSSELNNILNHYLSLEFNSKLLKKNFTNPEDLQKSFGGNFLKKRGRSLCGDYAIIKDSHASNGEEKKVLMVFSDCLIMCDWISKIESSGISSGERYYTATFEYHAFLENVEIYTDYDGDYDEEETSQKLMIRCLCETNLEKKVEVFRTEKAEDFKRLISVLYCQVDKSMKKKKGVSLKYFGECLKISRRDELERIGFLMMEEICQENKRFGIVTIGTKIHIFRSLLID